MNRDFMCGRAFRAHTTTLRMLALALTVAASSALPVRAQTFTTPDQFVVADDMTYSPYGYFKDGQPAGLDPDISRLVANKMGRTVRMMDIRFAQLIPGLRAHHYDAVASALYVTKERSRIIDYVAYTKTGSSILTLKTAKSKPATIDDLCGLQVSNIQGASWIPKILRDTKAVCMKANKAQPKMLEYPTSPEALLALKSGAADAMVEDSAVAASMAAREPDTLVVTTKDSFYPVIIAFGVAKDRPKLRDAIATALDKAREDGSYSKLLSKYGVQPADAADVKAVLDH